MEIELPRGYWFLDTTIIPDTVCNIQQVTNIGNHFDLQSKENGVYSAFIIESIYDIIIHTTGIYWILSAGKHLFCPWFYGFTPIKLMNIEQCTIYTCNVDTKYSNIADSVYYIVYKHIHPFDDGSMLVSTGSLLSYCIPNELGSRCRKIKINKYTDVDAFIRNYMKQYTDTGVVQFIVNDTPYNRSK